jgi:hypothetical protein
MTVYVPLFGDIGAIALLLLYVWLLSAIGASQLSRLKGYGEKPGLGTGLVLSVVGLIIWLFWPSKKDSRWREIFRRKPKQISTES